MKSMSHLCLEQAGVDGAASGNGAAVAVAKAPPPEAPNDYTTMVKQSFHFKRDVKRDDKGNVIKDPETGKPMVGSSHPDGKHPSVELYLPTPKTARLIEFLAEPEKYSKEVDLIKGAVFDVVYDVARQQINAARENDINATVGMANLNFDQLDWTAIANMPKAERGAWAPEDDDINVFLESYAAVMPEATGKTEAQIKNHLLLFQGRFTKQKAQKEILELFKGMLEIYLSKVSAEDMEEHLPVVEWFSNRLDRWLKAEEKITMDML